MGKRGRGYGTVSRRPDGRWEGQIRIPRGGRCSVDPLTRPGGGPPAVAGARVLGQRLPVSAGTTSLETSLARWLAITATRLWLSTVQVHTVNVQRLILGAEDDPTSRALIHWITRTLSTKWYPTSNVSNSEVICPA